MIRLFNFEAVIIVINCTGFGLIYSFLKSVGFIIASLRLIIGVSQDNDGYVGIKVAIALGFVIAASYAASCYFTCRDCKEACCRRQQSDVTQEQVGSQV